MLESDHSAAWLHWWVVMKKWDHNATRLTHLVSLLVIKLSQQEPRSKLQSLSQRNNSKRMMDNGTARKLCRLLSEFFRLSFLATLKLMKSKQGLLQTIIQDSESSLLKKSTRSSTRWLTHSERVNQHMFTAVIKLKLQIFFLTRG